MKVFCIGNITYDTTISVNEYPKENKKYRIDEKIECSGGQAANAACLLATWGIETYFIGSIGNDLRGENVKQDLKTANVNTKYLSEIKNKETANSYIINNKNNASRTIFTIRDEKLKCKTIKIEEIPEIILIDGQEYEISKKIINKYKDAITIIDAGRVTDHIIELAKKAKYLICSKDFAEEYTKEKIEIEDKEKVVNIYKKLKQDFKNEIIITLGENGVLYLNNNELKLMPSLNVKALDTTGAGDIFHGVFVYCLLQKYDLEKSIKISNIAGGLSTLKIGCRNSFPNLKEVMEIYEKI